MIPQAILCFVFLTLLALVSGIMRLSVVKIISCFVIAFSAYAFCNIPFDAPVQLSFLGVNLSLFEIDRVNFLIILTLHAIAIIGTLFSLVLNNRLEYASALFYFTSAIILLSCGDLLSAFFFWEMLTLGSVGIILASNQKNATAVANRYLFFHVFGGLLLLSGIVARYYFTGDLSLTKLDLVSWYNILIFLGVGVNVAFPLLHTWVVDAYPSTSPSGVIWLSGITTKTAVYMLYRLFPGESLLVWIGCVMMIFPVFYAVIENNLRRVLSYSLINQVGLIVTAIGIGGVLGLNGALAHIVTDIFFKSLLFMSIGAVMFRTGYQHATDLGGLYKHMPWTCFFCLIGALSISAFPLFSGFISKTLIVTAGAETHSLLLWLILLFASAAVLEHAGIKVPFFTFFAHDSKLKPKEAPLSMLFAMGLAAAVCLFIGFFPSTFYSLLEFEMNYKPYTPGHVITHLQLLLFSAFSFYLMLNSGIYPAEKRGTNLDIDYVYKKACRIVYRSIAYFTDRLNSSFSGFFHEQLPKFLSLLFKNFPANLIAVFAKPSTAERVHLAIMSGTLPVAISIVFALLFFIYIFGIIGYE